MVDWTKPIEWSDGTPSHLIHIVETEPPMYVACVYLPTDAPRINFPDMYRQQTHLTMVDVACDSGKIRDFFRPGGDGKPMHGYCYIRNKV